MPHASATQRDLEAENLELRARLEAAEETLRAIRADEVDAVIVKQGDTEQVCTLQGADQAYRTFVELMCQGAATVAADGSVLYCNRHFAELLRSPLDAAIGASIYEFVAPADEGSLRALIWEGLSSSCTARSAQLRRRDGMPISVVLTATPLNMDGVSGLCLVVTDLTDREARITAEAANRAKDRFLAALSHELRTPLSPIVMTVAALEMDANLPTNVREDLAMIRRNVELETRLIDDMLDLSRVITGKLRLRLEPVNMRGLIENVLKMVKSDVNRRSLQVQCKWAAHSDRVHGDPVRLQQVIWNVIKNAVKFSKERGTIEVRLLTAAAAAAPAADEQTLRLEIEDHGIGIDPAMLPGIFDAFEQGDAAISSQAGGLGLGLAIAKAIVEMHGGTMTAASDGIDKGTTVSVVLPTCTLDLPTRADTSAATTNIGRRDSKRLRLLLVEDHSETALVLARLLQRYGHEVEVAGTVASALQLVATSPFDLILSDIGLPDGTGHELMQQVAQKYQIPGVALTGYGMEDDLNRSRDVGFAAHVVKPVDIAQLQSVIERVSAT